MKTRKNTPIRINSIDFAVGSFIARLDLMMSKSKISRKWDSSGLWNHSFDRITPVPKKNSGRLIEGFKIHINAWREDSFINLIMRRDPTCGWKILVGYIHNEDFGIYNDFHFACGGFGGNLSILPRERHAESSFKENEEATSDFLMQTCIAIDGIARNK